MQFSSFKLAVAKQFSKMAQSPLFVTDVSGDELWETYLSSFPDGSNPIYRTRTEHDCSCCRQFIKNIGKAVAIKDGGLVSIWDIDPAGVDPAYVAVAEAMSAKVKSAKVSNVYRHYEKTVGTDKNFEQLLEGQKTWEHFYVMLPQHLIVRKDRMASVLGKFDESHALLVRSLLTISMDSVNTVQELIAQNSLYRGEEHSWLLSAFKTCKQQALDHAEELELFAWQYMIDHVSSNGTSSLCGIRNSVIGTLLVDLTKGVDLDEAVRAFEEKVAPANYKRPKALVTPAMIAAAKAKVEELGLITALQRRYATIDDISINDILFASSEARMTLERDVFDTLAVKAAPIKNFDKVESVTIDKFLADILPKATGIELMVSNNHVGNLMSLVAPVDPTAPTMFKWDNAFSWSYQGDVADSMKERVKKAGGNVEGELCCRLAWDYDDDLDFHMVEPTGNSVYFGNRRTLSPNGGMLDVDANGCDGIVPDPVENIFYKRISSMRDGEYLLKVNNYVVRHGGIGFQVEIDFKGSVTRLEYDKVLRTRETVEVATITKRGTEVTIKPLLPEGSCSKQVWGIATNIFVPVKVIMLSPNHWESSGSGVGNKHYFFILEGCTNGGTARGFYNEFLKPELEAHRKVIEMVGSKMRADESDRQLSGVGFSSTQRNSVTCRVSGSFNRIINITF